MIYESYDIVMYISILLEFVMNEDCYALLRFRVISCLRGWVGKT